MRVESAKAIGAPRLDPGLLRKELDELRKVHAGATDVDPALPMNRRSSSVGVVSEEMRAYDMLSPTEQQAASLGVNPESFRPIKELNEAHFDVLRKANALSPALEASIRAFRKVSES